MGIAVKSGGTWYNIKQMWVNNSGTWTPPIEVYVKNSGSWVLVYKYVYLGSNTQNYNLFSAFSSPSGPITAVFQLGNGNYIGSANTGSYALTISGFASGTNIYFYNGGYVLGCGGAGGPGGGGGGSNGAAGGPAIFFNNPITIGNYGIIAGGGGGGAGGPIWPGHAGTSGAGGGGGGGWSAGAGGAGTQGLPNGSAGSNFSGGASGGGHCTAGNGGDIGADGQSTGSCDAQPGATGGSRGYWGINTGNITWENVGDVRGYAT